MTDYNNLIGLVGKQYMLSGMTTGAGSFAQVAGSFLDYNVMKADAGNLYVQANQIELQAQERANMLREQFLSSVGTYQYGAAQRNISVGSGSVVGNIERSAGKLGEDITTMQKSAGLEARALRTQATNMRKAAKANQVSNILGAVGSLAGAVGSFALGYSMWDKATNPTLANGGKVAPVPQAKPNFG